MKLRCAGSDQEAQPQDRIGARRCGSGLGKGLANPGVGKKVLSENAAIALCVVSELAQGFRIEPSDRQPARYRPALRVAVGRYIA